MMARKPATVAAAVKEFLSVQLVSIEDLIETNPELWDDVMAAVTAELGEEHMLTEDQIIELDERLRNALPESLQKDFRRLGDFRGPLELVAREAGFRVGIAYAQLRAKAGV